MSNTTIRFTKGPKGFFGDGSERFGRKSIKIRYVPDRSQKDPIEGCYYEFEITHEIPHPTRNLMKTCFVKLINREQNEAQHQVNMELAEAEMKRELQLKYEVAQIKKEIDSQWIEKYESIHEAIRQFFYIGKPHNIADVTYWSSDISRIILNFHTWKENFKKVMDWEIEFPNIIKFMEENSESSNRNFKDADVQLTGLITQIAEIDGIITNYPKKLIFIKSADAEVEIFYDRSETRLAYMKKVYGKYTHYYAESDDGYRAAGSCEVNGWHSQKFFVNNEEAESILPMFKDLIDSIETKRVLDDRLNQERKDWVLKRKAEGYAIAERLLPQELLKHATTHIH